MLYVVNIATVAVIPFLIVFYFVTGYPWYLAPIKFNKSAIADINHANSNTSVDRVSPVSNMLQ